MEGFATGALSQKKQVQVDDNKEQTEKKNKKTRPQLSHFWLFVVQRKEVAYSQQDVSKNVLAKKCRLSSKLNCHLATNHSSC